MSKLILIRHGETNKNIHSKLHSADDPEELNDNGKDQIRKTAIQLEKHLPLSLYCSKEKRAIQSASIIAEKLNLKVNKVEGLQERNWGKFSDKSWSKINKILESMNLQERYDYIPPEGESWREFEERLIHALNKVISHSQCKNIIIVTHGGSIRALMPYLLKLPKQESFKYNPDNATLTIFEIIGNNFKEVTINSSSHL